MNISIEEIIEKLGEKFPYRDKYIEQIEQKLLTIIEFFKIIYFDDIKIVIWKNIEDYKNHISKYTEYKEEMCADTYDGNINMLDINEARKTETHKNITEEEFIQNLVHEFVHICHQKAEIEHDEDNTNAWFYEALATNLGNKEQFNNLVYFTESKEELEQFNNIKNNRYEKAYTIGKYLLENYSKEEILEYVRYPSKLKKDTNKIIEEAKKWIDIQKINKKQ